MLPDQKEELRHSVRRVKVEGQDKGKTSSVAGENKISSVVSLEYWSVYITSTLRCLTKSARNCVQYMLSMIAFSLKSHLLGCAGHQDGCEQTMSYG